MTNGWGGARKGAGRPRGKPTRRTETRLTTPTLPVIPEKAHRRYVEVMPVDVLLQATRDVNLPIELRLAAAKAAAPYFHARVSVGPPKSSHEMSDFELAAAIEREKQYQATGRDPGPPLIEGRVDDHDA